MSGRGLHPADAATALSSLGMALAAVAIAVAGPMRSLPVHWGWDGMADAFATRAAVALIVALLALITAILGFGLGLAARAAAGPPARARLRLGQLALVTGLSAMALLGALASLLGVISLTRPAPLTVLGLTLALLAAMVARVVARRRAWQDAGDRRSE